MGAAVTLYVAFSVLAMMNVITGCFKIFRDHRHFSRMRSEGSRLTWGSGGEAVFAKFCVCVRNRSQVFATEALHSGERVWSGPESVSC